jgi:hypothetical protein
MLIARFSQFGPAADSDGVGPQPGADGTRDAKPTSNRNRACRWHQGCLFDFRFFIARDRARYLK